MKVVMVGLRKDSGLRPENFGISDYSDGTCKFCKGAVWFSQKELEMGGLPACMDCADRLKQLTRNMGQEVYEVNPEVVS